jgi:hypothetical protein
MFKRVFTFFVLLALAFLIQCSSSYHPAAQTVGPQGPAGQAATITVGQTITGASGSAAQVTNSGTSSAAVLNFVIPQGIQGPQGPAGPLLPPLLAIQGPGTLSVSPTNGNAQNLGGPTVTATIKDAQLVSLTFSADSQSASAVNCYIFVVQNGNVSGPVFDQSQVFAVFGGVSPSGGAALISASLAKTVFAMAQPGTYSLQLWYAGTSCSFAYSRIALQSYGAGSTMQSSGTF